MDRSTDIKEADSYRYEDHWLDWGDPKMKKVLIIEDEPFIASLLASIIEEYGYEVTIVYDGRKGYELARTGRYKLVITDNMLPHMSGQEICSRLKQEPNTKGIFIILMSAVTNVAELKSEATAFLSKPFDISTVDQLVQKYLIDVDTKRKINIDEAAYPVENYNNSFRNYSN